MKNYTLWFLGLALITGLLGFYPGMDFFGIKAVRIFFIIFTDLLIVSLLAKGLFPSRLVPVKQRKNNKPIHQK